MSAEFPQGTVVINLVEAEGETRWYQWCGGKWHGSGWVGVEADCMEHLPFP